MDGRGGLRDPDPHPGLPAHRHPGRASGACGMNRTRNLPDWVGRAVACLLGSVVLAIMVGPQQGSRDDYGLTFREQVLSARIVWFLLIGVLVFLAISYRDIVA